MSKKFPTYHSHHEVHCFNCGVYLHGSDPKDSGYPQGRGQWKQDCPKCQMSTWYDVVPVAHLECVGADHFKLHVHH